LVSKFYEVDIKSNPLFSKSIDITNDASIKEAVEKVEQRLNGKDLNCLINNAGTAKKLRFMDINEKDMMETYRQNVIGPWKVTKVYLTISFSIDTIPVLQTIS
jgi:short-subunit dehydrogenase